jgi:dCMP deaminase
MSEDIWDYAWKNLGYLQQLCDGDFMLVDAKIKELMAEAYVYAKEHATDPSTQNGALIIDPWTQQVLAQGANHFPRGVQENDFRWERPQKYQFVEHAERNSIYDAAAKGIKTDGRWMICPWYACTDCARAIIQAKIKKVIGHQTTLDWTPEHWKDSIEVALNMLDEAGVEYTFWTGKVFEEDEVKIRFNGELRSP